MISNVKTLRLSKHETSSVFNEWKIIDDSSQFLEMYQKMLNTFSFGCIQIYQNKRAQQRKL